VWVSRPKVERAKELGFGHGMECPLISPRYATPVVAVVVVVVAAAFDLIGIDLKLVCVE
jgi:hypothetical protein